MTSAIDPGAIPGKGIDPDEIERQAKSISSIGGSVADNGLQVQSRWQGMAGVYSAPESGTLLGLMQPVSEAASSTGENLGVVASALSAFAEDVRPIKQRLDALRVEAQTFVDTTVANGVYVEELNPAWVSMYGYGYGYGGYGSYGYSSYGYGSSSGASDSEPDKYRTVHREWHEDQDAVDRNNDLISQVNAQQVLLWEAERTCANKIRAIACMAPLHSGYESETDALGYGVDEIPDGTDMPWGAEVERTEGCGEAAVNFVFKDFLWEGIAVGGVWGTIQGLGTLVLGYDQTTGEWFQGDAYGAAWGGLGMLVAGLATLGPVTIADNIVEGVTGGEGFITGPVGDFVDSAEEALLNTGKSLIAWDQWQDDPGTAAGSALFNIGTIFIPAGAAVSGVKGASLAARVASKAATVVDLVDPASLAFRGVAGAGRLGLSSIDNLLGRLDDLSRFETPRIETHAATDAASALNKLDEWGVDLNDVTTRVNADGSGVFSFPGGEIEVPGGTFDVPGGSADVPAPVREPELVLAGGGRAETATPGVVDSIVHDSPVRTDTAGTGESTVVREPETGTTTGSGGAGHGGGDAGTGGGAYAGGDADTAGGSGTSRDAGAGDGAGTGSGDTGGTGSAGSAAAGSGAQPPASVTLPDGSSYSPWTSRYHLAQVADSEPIITQVAAEHGLTVSDVHGMIRRHETGAPLDMHETQVLLDIRESIPMPQQGEIMQKVVSADTWQRYLQQRWDTVQGFVGRGADSQKLITSDDYYHGFGLDYGPNRSTPEFLDAHGDVGELYAIRFANDGTMDLHVPAADAGADAGYLFDANGEPYYHPHGMGSLGSDNPYHGNGFVGTGDKELIPEYHLASPAKIGDNAEVWKITPTGEEVLVAVRLRGRWVGL
ncbi:hypothetical protein IF188_10910 [Microbacterium sp. NEAU-LLC]|uniref:Uncharacterized protein n=1 Tax=Microbacterium helvum TaxID=2773713 RepID=A0ABR8NNH2_9MICO|nr:hypothetical protein [Microbacterium helvum]MBD3942205.1 hypothetical protein [Microbacterium helvum]